MAKRKRNRRKYFCSIHGGPFLGRGWGGHKSRGCKGQRMTPGQYKGMVIQKVAPVGVKLVKAPSIERFPNFTGSDLAKGLQQRLADISREITTLDKRINALRSAYVQIAHGIRVILDSEKG